MRLASKQAVQLCPSEVPSPRSKPELGPAGPAKLARSFLQELSSQVQPWSRLWDWWSWRKLPCPECGHTKTLRVPLQRISQAATNARPPPSGRDHNRGLVWAEAHQAKTHGSGQLSYAPFPWHTQTCTNTSREKWNLQTLLKPGHIAPKDGLERWREKKWTER